MPFGAFVLLMFGIYMALAIDDWQIKRAADLRPIREPGWLPRHPNVKVLMLGGIPFAFFAIISMMY